MGEDRPVPEARARSQRRLKTLAMLSLAALALHAALIGEMETAPAPHTITTAPMAVRTLTEPALAAMPDGRTDELAPEPPPAALPPSARAPRPSRLAHAPVPSKLGDAPLPTKLAGEPLPAKPTGAPLPTKATGALMPAKSTGAPMPPQPQDIEAAAPALAVVAQATEPLAVLAEQTVADSAGVAAPASAPPDASASAEPPVPVYRTRPPPAVTLRFGMSRGLLHGTAELSWRPSGGQYELRLDGHIAGLTILSQVSQGGFDSAGLAPVRFTDQRLRGAMNAANFQRQAGKVTFSGPQTEFALQRGVQDRLSWMVQLPAIVAAEPKLLLPGAKVALHVIGARADAAVWVLRFVGREAIDVAGNSVQAEKFSREASGPRETAVDIWLDPQRHHLPVRATLRNGDDDALELALQEMTAGP